MSPRTILFICTGNTCRSPMAEALLTARLTALWGSAVRFEVRSAGLEVAVPGGPATREAITVLAGRGIDLTGHSARQLDSAGVGSADLILTMTEAHKARLSMAFPPAIDRVFTLGEYVGRASDETRGEVPDPFGRGLPAYEACVAKLEGLLDSLVQLIRSEEGLSLTKLDSPRVAGASGGPSLADRPLAAATAVSPVVAGRIVTRLAVGADHAGYLLKDQLAAAAAALGIEVEDQGTGGPGSVDYPDFAERVGLAVASGRCQAGLLVCGTGLGMAIAANKVQGIRAVTCNDLYAARMAREHNDANVLCVGARVIAFELAREVLATFLQTPFAGGRHIMRVSKIADLEGRSSADLLGKGW